ncbi:MAG: type II 3-dehydroquinate dehydratase [Sphingobacteriales bacterium]|nr:MAG: type II 3-dehydroquinate dehydratase [Sphingobacteriales bacterium]
MLTIEVINGPNLNLIGTREPDIYGDTSLEAYLETLAKQYPDLVLHARQSNIEGELIDFLHDCRHNANGIILNAGAYTHTSLALADAIAAISVPVVEVHISNVLAREEIRKTSYIASKCVGSISGLGLYGYELALQYFIKKLH